MSISVHKRSVLVCRPILPVLANVFDQALEGGGAKNINFQALAADLAEITFEYPFRIPPCGPRLLRLLRCKRVDSLRWPVYCCVQTVCCVLWVCATKAQAFLT